MHYATTSGTGSRTFCPAAKAMWEALRRTIGWFVEAVLYRYKAGIPWRDLPALWGLEDRPSALWPMGEERSFRAHFQAVDE
jgi:hypothetical protein